ncbi:MAG TPA: septum formation initiator family protein [Acidimicrobiales bacterium]
MTRRTVVLLAAAGATLAVLVLVVFPTRSYLKERGDVNSASHQLQVINSQNRQLTDQIGRLNTDAEIERVARKDYGLVKPGEEAYAILPGALAKSAVANKPATPRPAGGTPPAGPPVATPRGQATAAPAHQGLWGRFVDQLAFWR